MEVNSEKMWRRVSMYDLLHFLHKIYEVGRDTYLETKYKMFYRFYRRFLLKKPKMVLYDVINSNINLYKEIFVDFESYFTNRGIFLIKNKYVIYGSYHLLKDGNIILRPVYTSGIEEKPIITNHYERIDGGINE